LLDISRMKGERWNHALAVTTETIYRYLILILLVYYHYLEYRFDFNYALSYSKYWLLILRFYFPTIFSLFSPIVDWFCRDYGELLCDSYGICMTVVDHTTVVIPTTVVVCCCTCDYCDSDSAIVFRFCCDYGELLYYGYVWLWLITLRLSFLF
jgi:hypothetical protein